MFFFVLIFYPDKNIWLCHLFFESKDFLYSDGQLHGRQLGLKFDEQSFQLVSPPRSKGFVGVWVVVGELKKFEKKFFGQSTRFGESRQKLKALPRPLRVGVSDEPPLPNRIFFDFILSTIN